MPPLNTFRGGEGRIDVGSCCAPPGARGRCHDERAQAVVVNVCHLEDRPHDQHTLQVIHDERLPL
eukprot:11991420-Alexandrium_andersonii.AAC.1